MLPIRLEGFANGTPTAEKNDQYNAALTLGSVAFFISLVNYKRGRFFYFLCDIFNIA
jgi:hypothetical protein